MSFFIPKSVDLFTFNALDLHVSLLNEISVQDCKIDKLMNKLDKVITNSIPVTIVAGEQEMFGENYNIPAVKIIEKTGHLKKLHNTIFHTVTSCGGSIAKPHYAQEGWVPHVSNTTLKDFSTQILDHFSLIKHGESFGEDVKNLGNFWFGKELSLSSV
jgi:ribulose 1,5-bisphosphate synthetase/thiazole synthase